MKYLNYRFLGFLSIKSFINCLIINITLYLLLSSCNYNPLGGKNSYIDQGNTPFLKSPYPFLINGALTSSEQLVLTWENSLQATDYTVIYGTSSGNYTHSASNCLNIKNNLCTVLNLTNGITYYFNVKAKNIFGSINASKEIKVTPNIFSISSRINSKSALIFWPDVSAGLGNTSYTIQLGTSPNTVSQIIPGTTNPYLITGLTDGQTYYFQVTATNMAGTIISQQTSNLIIDPPSTPTWIAPPTVSVGQNNLNWNASTGTGTIRYTAYTGSISGGPYHVVPGCVSLNSLSCIENSSTLIPGNIYYYILTATNEGGDSPNSTEVSATTYPAVPTGFTVNPATNLSNNVSWDNSPGNANITYNIYRSTTAPVSITPGNKITSINSTLLNPIVLYTDIGPFTENTIYYYSLTATNVSGTSGNSTTQSIVSALSTAPSSLVASSVNSSSLTLGWSLAAGNATVLFNVYRSTINNPTTWNTSVYTGNNFLFNDTGLSENTNYYYIVTAINSRLGAAPQQSAVFNTVTALQTPPTFNTTTNVTENSVTLNWNPPPNNGSVTYKLYRSTTSSTGPWIGPINTPSSDLTFTDTGLSENTNYYYMVSATNSAPGAIALNSIPLSITTTLTTAPTFVLPTNNVTDNSITLNWNPSPNNGSVTYKLYRSTTSSTGPWIGPINTPSSDLTFTDTGLSENTNYYYMVTATNTTPGAAALQSSSYSATTDLSSIPTFTATTNTTSNSTTLTWNSYPNNGIVTFKLYRSLTGSNGSWGSPINTTSTTTTFVDSGLSENTVYYYMLTATNTAVGGTTKSSSNLTITTQFNPTDTFSLTATAISSSSYTLNWVFNFGSANVNYTIWQDGVQIITSCSLTNITPSTTNTNCIITGLSENTSYSFVVKASNNATGGSSTVSSASLTVLTTPQTPPTGLKLTITSNTVISASWNAYVLGNNPVTYKIYASTNSSVAINTTNLFCNNISIVSCSNNQVSGANLSIGTTYYFVIVVSNSSGSSSASSPPLSLLFNQPANTDIPTITGLSSSAIVQNPSVTLTGSLGTWSDTNSCNYQWYSSTIPIAGASGAITPENSPVSYVTQSSDVCSIISFGVTCTNGIGTTTVFNQSPNNSTGINTTSILNNYVTRATAVTAGGKLLLQNFLDQLISNNLPLPNVMIPMLASQNQGLGTTVYDLFCNQNNANLSSALPWDNTGGIIPNSNGLATIPNVFSGNNSTIIAFNRSPAVTTNTAGVAGYTSGTNSLNSFGYGGNTSSLIFESFSSNPSLMLNSLSQGRYDFWGVSMNGVNVILQQNEMQRIETANSNKSGGLVLGSLNGNSGTGLQDYLTFISAWNKSAFTMQQLELVRRIAQATVVSNVQIFPAYMYIGNAKAIAGSYFLSVCSINQTNGSLSSCTTTGTGFGNPIGVARYNNFIYSASGSTFGNIVRCAINITTGALSSCTQVASSLSTLYGLAVSNGLSNTYLYVGALSNVYICQINSSNGNLGTCSSTGSGFSGASGLIFNYITGTPYLYVTNRSANQVKRCSVNASNGTLGSCVTTGSGFNGPTGIVINNGYAYVANAGSNTVIKCSVNLSDGTLNSCATATSGALYNSLEGISVINSYIYIANWGNNSVVKCLISATDGSLGGCATTGSGFNGSIGIAW